MSNDIITIEPAKLVVAKDKMGEITLTPDASVELKKILLAQQLIENILQQAKDIIAVEMEKHHLKKIDAGSIVIKKRLGGRKYKKAGVVAEEFLKEVSYSIVDSDKVASYADTHGVLPEGVEENEREESVSVEMV